MASLFKIGINRLKGVGSKSAECLKKLGIATVGDIIKFYPRSYEDWTIIQTLTFAKGKKEQCVRLKILSSVRTLKLRSGKTMYKIEATDGQSFADVIFFNSKYIAESLKLGKEYLFRGNVTGNLLKFELVSPKFKNIDDELKFYPIYRQTKGISSSKIAKLIQLALSMLPEHIPETFPNYILRDNNICSLDFAVKNIHFPKNQQDLKTARKRIVFEKFFLYQLGMSRLKNQARQKTNVVALSNCLDSFFSLLPFKLTETQKKIIDECIKDIESGFSMNRLLQGDVGSGKTVIAVALAYIVSINCFQTAVMAPTEILAVQHYKTFCDFFKNTDIKVVLLYGTMKSKEKKAVIRDIETGNADIVIGTHSLISDNIKFGKLGLIVTDEQHRFGVNQRAQLVEKGEAPHVLVMSATPIPRTLAMILYGDLDISILNEALPGRQKVDTFQIDESKRRRSWNFIKRIISEGGQGYIVCASIEENENEIVDVKSYREKMIEDDFSPNEVEILHGKMHPTQKDEIMKRFISGEIKILVSTTVIEVGIDVPAARIIVIENAERFGISQLHQLRGRVGRNNSKSYCILISNAKNRDAVRRFNAMVNSYDGFYLSEEDLKIRGPGDFFGVNQHGVPNVGIPTSYEDVELMKEAQKSAKKFLEQEINFSSIQFRFLKRSVDEMFKDGQNDELKNIIF